MNAEEMFKKLGYKKRAFGNCIFYEKGSIMRHIIQFNLKDKIFIHIRNVEWQIQ